MPTFPNQRQNFRLLPRRGRRVGAQNSLILETTRPIQATQVIDSRFELDQGSASYGLSGIAMDQSSVALPYSDVHLFDSETKALLATTKADSVGRFSFNVPVNPQAVFAVAYKAGSPDIFGTTINSLVLTPAPTPRLIVADVFIDMISSDADSTVLTTTNLANGTHGTYSSWSLSTSPLTGMSIGSPGRFKRRSPVQVGSTIYPVTNLGRPIVYDHHQTLRGCHLIFNAGVSKASVGWFMTLGPLNEGNLDALFDLMGFYGFSGEYASFQLDNGQGLTPGRYSISIETNPNGATTHSQYFDLVPGGTYWCSLFADMLNGNACACVFDPITWQLLQTTSIKMTKNDTIERLRIGNNEVGGGSSLSGNTITYFGEICVDTTYARYPLGP